MGVHVALAQGRDQYRASDQGDRQGDPCVLAKSDQAQGEDDVGVELRADAPARQVPGQEFVQMEALDEQQIGENRVRRFRGGAEQRYRVRQGERRD